MLHRYLKECSLYSKFYKLFSFSYFISACMEGSYSPSTWNFFKEDDLTISNAAESTTWRFTVKTGSACAAIKNDIKETEHQIDLQIWRDKKKDGIMTLRKSKGRDRGWKTHGGREPSMLCILLVTSGDQYLALQGDQFHFTKNLSDLTITTLKLLWENSLVIRAWEYTLIGLILTSFRYYSTWIHNKIMNLECSDFVSSNVTCSVCFIFNIVSVNVSIIMYYKLHSNCLPFMAETNLSDQLI